MSLKLFCLNKYVRLVFLVNIFVVLMLSFAFAGHWGIEDMDNPGSEYNFPADEKRKEVNLTNKYFDDSSSGNTNGNTNGNTSGSKSSGRGGSGGGGGGGGGSINKLKAGATEPNRFIGPYKNAVLKSFPAEENYIINTIKEGKFAGQLRVRSKNDKMLYGFYMIKSSYSNDINVYFFDFDAKIHTGFLADTTGDVYYFSSDGTMFTGKKNIKGVDYEFNSDGALKAEYLSVLKAAKPEIYCVNSSEWQQQIKENKWKLAKKNFYGEIEGYYKNEVMLRYDSTKNEIYAYLFDKDGYLVENETYLKEGVLCSVSKDSATFGQITNLVVPNMSTYLNEEVFSSEVQLANYIVKWKKN